jgi:hypothetical protein
MRAGAIACNRQFRVRRGHRIWLRTDRANVSDHPERFGLRRMEMSGRAERGRVRASLRGVARFSAAWPQLLRARSASKPAPGAGWSRCASERARRGKTARPGAWPRTDDTVAPCGACRPGSRWLPPCPCSPDPAWRPRPDGAVTWAPNTLRALGRPRHALPAGQPVAVPRLELPLPTQLAIAWPARRFRKRTFGAADPQQLRAHEGRSPNESRAPEADTGAA